MKRVIAITSAIVLSCTALASAQSSEQNRPLAEVAKQEEARRKTARPSPKVYTNDNLRGDISKGVPLPPSATASAASTNSSPSNTSPARPGATAAPGQGQEYWAGRMKAAREQLQRTQMFADSLQSRINALTTDFVNRDDPAQKAKIEADRKAALAELERVRKEAEEQTKAITAIEEEARRAGVPSGWLRPGA